MAFYDVIGKTYAQTRRSDPRITKKLLRMLYGKILGNTKGYTEKFHIILP